MGWLDVFGKKADVAAAAATSADPAPPGARRFTGDRARMFDLAQTQRLFELFAQPRQTRDDSWQDGVYDAVWTASLEVGSPAVFEGPDGFPYLRLQIPAAGAFQSNSLANLAAGAVEHAHGAAIFASPEAKEAAFVIYGGVLDSLLRFDSWRGDPRDLEELARQPPASSEGGFETVTASQDRQVLVGSPSADYLPPATARALHHHLTVGWKMDDPRVSLLIDPGMAPTRNLMISRSFDEFPSPEHRAEQVRMLLWYLPPKRSLLLRPKGADPTTMTPLSQLFPAAS